MARKIMSPTGKQIKIMLLQHDMEQRELAVIMGISAGYMKEICNDNRDAFTLRAKISDYFKQLSANNVGEPT